MPDDAGQLDAIEHMVVLMLENRSFDHMLGWLYADEGNVSPSMQPYEGLTGAESNPDGHGGKVTVFRIDGTAPHAYFMPGANPGEGYAPTNKQLFGTSTPATPTPTATNDGFVTDYADTLVLRAAQHRPVYPGTTAADIMGCFDPQALPVLSGLARGFAVADHWFCSVPTETLPNRAFACAATSLGHMDDATHTFATPSIFGRLSEHGIDWAVYGYDKQPLTRGNFPDTAHAPASHFGLFTDFRAAAAGGTLPAFTFLEPSWRSTGNSQHPNYDVALGEQLIHDVYRALRDGPAWAGTLLIITYDEHGGCYDHVPPPNGALPPDSSAGQFGFDFTRFGVRVPTVLVSPLIEPGTVFRVPDGSTPLDHTSVLKTVEQRWNLPSLTARDAAAPGLAAVLTRTQARTDDPLTGVTVPVSTGTNPARHEISHLEQVHAALVARNLIPRT
ncbi:alkaline phosphatase family protein [Streptomyces coacervatus]|uniref:Alkaline phosphatase family protein n=1 Tax=Streptomyces coacervatus TaxID=647381 RepID=A0ABP7HYA9_9ACTN|nr:alkaline phosphatase family protein [Streptomyces coacervatus]MDF2269534.1 alkaline phosphatase family protein [Streptomyces coacervatus]